MRDEVKKYSNYHRVESVNFTTEQNDREGHEYLILPFFQFFQLSHFDQDFGEVSRKLET